MARFSNFIRFLNAESLLSYEDAKELTEASEQANALFGQLLLRRGVLTLREMVGLLEKQARDPAKRLGELAVAAGHLTEQQLGEFLAEQPSAGGQHPIDTLRMRGLLSPESLLEALVAYVKQTDDIVGPVDP